MIEVKTERGKTQLKAEGSVADLCSDTLLLIHNVYTGLREDNMIGSLMYRKAIEENIKVAFELTDEEVKREC